MQDVRGGAGVCQCSVLGCDRRPEVLRKRCEFAVANLAGVQRHPCQARGVERAARKPREVVTGTRGLEEAEIVGSVMRDQDCVPCEFAKRRHGTGHRGSVANHGVGDSGEGLDVSGNRAARFDKGGEFSEYPATTHFHCTDFGDTSLGCRATGGLEIDDDEREL